MCAQCHSFSAHLFEKLGSELGPWDGMTLKNDFCNALVTECTGQIAFGGLTEYDGQTYCEKHVGGVGGADQFWSYPYVDREPAPVTTSFLKMRSSTFRVVFKYVYRPVQGL